MSIEECYLQIPASDDWNMHIMVVLNCRGLMPLTATSIHSTHPKRIYFPGNMVRASVQGKLRMRRQNTNRAVPLDAVPERRTERCSPRFRPGDRFCELSFRYLSPGIEGEKCRPLDHRWQIPFIHSTRFISSSNSIYTTPRSSHFLHVVHSSASWYGAHLTIAHALLQKHSFKFQSHYSSHVVFRIGTCSCMRTKLTAFTHAHLLSKRKFDLFPVSSFKLRRAI